MEAYQDYPLHNWLTNGHYDREASKRIMEVSLRTMANDGVIYADSPELNGFAAWLPLGFTGSTTVPFLPHGGLRLILRPGGVPGLRCEPLRDDPLARAADTGGGGRSGGMTGVGEGGRVPA